MPALSAEQALADRINAGAAALVRHWLAAVVTGLSLLNLLPWLAPIFMHVGWQRPARLIYLAYSLLCHQLPERSWFLFGAVWTPSLQQIEAAGGAGDFVALRQFIGTAQMGWKLGWSDRMVSFYGGLLLFALLYALLRRARPAWRGLSWRVALLLLVPILADGLSHAVSDLWGVEQGFREANGWLVFITGNLLPATFYSGDAWGSFNSLARLVTGLVAATGLVFWIFPLVDRALQYAVSPAAFDKEKSS